MQDLISRQEAINSIGKCTDIYVNNLPTMVDKAEAYKALNELPSAQPETGYWISARDEDGRHMWLICSECGAKETNLKAKYCPVCGRKMA